MTKRKLTIRKIERGRIFMACVTRGRTVVGMGSLQNRKRERLQG